MNKQINLADYADHGDRDLLDDFEEMLIEFHNLEDDGQRGF
jgi:hypothetical protein